MTSVIIIIQLFVTIVMGLYFYNALKGQKSSKVVINKENTKEAEKLRRMKNISLTEPLTEKSRPTTFEDIIGQEKGIKALKAAICGPNPQHVIIYGPPGVGKTAAARLVLEAAKLIPSSPFRGFSKFVEVDATTIRFDERGIADPLIGSVHDPIYQGAGPLGIAGVPQPKPGAVTKAHGGILFLDEIGELHPIELNKLLKVLEDRKVFLDSAYYNSEDPNMPSYIKEIFDEGLPADFRLIGATTRSPEEIVPAIRSRCVEIFFRALDADEIKLIARNAVAKMGIEIDEEAAEMVGLYASNGRDAVNLVQLACGIVINEKRSKIGVEEVQWVIENGQYSPRPNKKVCSKPRVGYVNGLAVVGANTGAVMEIEATARRIDGRDGIVKVTGIVEEEEIGDKNRKLRRKGTARNSIDNVLTVLERFYNLEVKNYDIHVNFPGGQPVDGPSAGISITTAIYSAITGKTIDNLIAMTGEISIHGEVKPVGGVTAKITGAIKAGAKKVIIPKENWQDIYAGYKEVEVIPMSNIKDVINEAIVSETVLHVNLENKDGTFGIMASPQLKA
ncbi:MAG: ATP-dependent protease LonB [Clostridium sp.]|uniref:ATP-dependent protease LonB n=1 Tax=Clostridium culturomicium TaxID=1499683 RepID=UPI00058FB77D|nr:ATP-dependent protease LonB [Clostridium culturomicium]MDU4892642.1 ATP-dependent protease LonB [Clostridium sp.]MDU7082073.1 ATP-dependent protease LonB [Clostridium sp.]